METCGLPSSRNNAVTHFCLQLTGPISQVCSALQIRPKEKTMAKPTTVKIRLNSTAGTGYFYVTKKNARTMTEKMVKKKYDPVARKHVDFKEGKIK